MTLAKFVRNTLIDNLKYKPTPGQEQAIELLGDFLPDDENASCFILKGYAGTGKTTLIGALVRTLQALGMEFQLLAPTGRAAKVLSSTAGIPASTIHRTIYSVEDSTTGAPSFLRRKNLSPGTLFIVDEASMVSHRPDATLKLISESLLNDLIAFVKGAEGCRLMLVGDTAQLPPVGESHSAALEPDALRYAFPEIYECTLTEVVRQEKESGILHYATAIRNDLDENNIVLPTFSTRIFPDFSQLQNYDFESELHDIYSKTQVDENIILTRSNRRANEYNTYIRQTVLDRTDPLVPGDRLMVCRNSYFWTKDIPAIPFIANGDMIRLERISNRTQKYGMIFADIDFTLEDFPDIEISATCMLDVLKANTPALPQEQSQELYRSVRLELEQKYGKNGLAERVRHNPYLNALQLKYGYAVTCHKAQGGQWENVLLDVELYRSIEISRDLLRWIYTAITRARRHLYLINPPRTILAADSYDEF